MVLFGNIRNNKLRKDMKKFPGVLSHGGGNHRQIIFTDEQMEWLRKWYPVTENGRIAKAMGISVESVRKYARLNGIHKSERGLKAIRKRQNKAMVRTFNKNGLYDAKRGRPCSEATMEGNRRRWQEVRDGKRLDPISMVRMNDPKRYDEIMKKKSIERRESIRKEKLRVLYGLERKTSLRGVVMKPFTRSQIAHRHCALVRGYLLDEDCREGQSGRYVIWYDAETERSKEFEENCIKDGFEIREAI